MSSHLLESRAESVKHGFHVSTLLHRDDASVILFIDPNKEVLSLVMPDSTAVRPVTGHTSTGQQGGDRLVKQEVVLQKRNGSIVRGDNLSIGEMAL